MVFDKNVDASLVEVCMEIEKRYEVYFLEIGTDLNHVHFLLQSVPIKSSTWIVKMLKSITAREIFKRHPEIKRLLWGGNLWSSGHFVNTVSKFGDESTISKYVRDQGNENDTNCYTRSNS